ncbi:FecR domain-containing protein [Prolixibacteraceae bacterium Z1-6]|uniref:FecR domain-containing protein n=1 Tax=Draconibacterium aestuarii TaxID=2998507 RepID=A0A9X3J7I2_9BACT|nr:FecR domain-containing protein [Prolixibacteraceae bacterium Z1-6]
MGKYSTYTSTDFLNEETFIRWRLKSDKEAVKFWENFVKKYPDKQEEVNEAIEIFNHFNFAHEELTLDEIFTIWNNVKHHSEKKRNGGFAILKYAAIFILVFATGALSYYFYSSSQSNEFTIAETTPVNFNEAQVILPGGKSVPLRSKDSEIRYDATGEKVIIDNDTISQQPNQVKSEMNRVIIPYGKSSQLTLSDGTKVWLNAGSQLMYPSVFSSKQREVLLIGEAFFEVVKNETSPFIVRTDQADVEVLGTRFDVSAYPDDKIFQTVLVSGSVSVETRKEGMLGRKDKKVLEPNQMYSLDKQSGVNYVHRVDVEIYTSWKEGMFNCDKQDLNRVVRKLERYYNKKIHIKDPMLGSYKISGKLDLKNDISDVLDVIQAFVPIDWGKQKNGDYFIVKPN